MTASISVLITASPFHSPLSRTLGKVYQRVHAYFCPGVNEFISETMDTTPATTLGRVRWDIQILPQKTRPYQEKDFVEPIAATTMDEVQLSTAASAWQRIHDSAPNSHHSEALQWSVWRVTGCASLRVPPLFNLPSWIIDRWRDEECSSHLPPIMVVALVAVSLRAHHKEVVATSLAMIRAVHQRVDNPKTPLGSTGNRGFRPAHPRHLATQLH